MLRIAPVTLLLMLAFGCGKSTDEQLREDIKKDMERNALIEPKKETPKTREAPPPAAKKEEAPPDPEPTTPAEIDTARKKAMIAGRDKDVVRFCELGKIGDTSDSQAVLGCALAACRLDDEAKASAWAKLLKNNKKDGKALLDQAIKTCAANKVVLSLQ
jgi:hypothetical protein